MIRQFLSFTQIWIALGAFVTTCFSWLWAADLFRLDHGDMLVAVWVSCSTGLGYTLQRAIKHTRHPHAMPTIRRTFWDRWKWTMVVGWMGLWIGFNIAFVADLGWDEPRRLSVAIGLGLASLTYAFVPLMNGGLRKVSWLKIPLIAVVWATATTHHPAHGIDPVLWAQRALFIAGLTLPFDIRDIEIDRPHMTTIPMVTSAKRALNLSRNLIAAAGAISFLVWVCRCMQDGLKPHEAIPLALSAQCLWAHWILRPGRALAALQGDESLRENFTGWRLDGVLAAPFLVIASAFLMLLL